MNTLITVLSYILVAASAAILAWVILFSVGRKKRYSGTMRVIRADDKLLYSLEVDEDPAVLEFQREVIFKVETSDESS